MTGGRGELACSCHCAQKLTRAQAAAGRKVRLPQGMRELRLPGANVHAVLLPPINFIFKLLQQRATVSIWLYENLGMRIEGKLRVSIHRTKSNLEPLADEA